MPMYIFSVVCGAALLHDPPEHDHAGLYEDGASWGDTVCTLHN